MKKIMILMLSLAVLFSFAACDNSSNTPSGGEEGETSTNVSSAMISSVAAKVLGSSGDLNGGIEDSITELLGTNNIIPPARSGYTIEANPETFAITISETVDEATPNGKYPAQKVSLTVNSVETGNREEAAVKGEHDIVLNSFTYSFETYIETVNGVVKVSGAFPGYFANSLTAKVKVEDKEGTDTVTSYVVTGTPEIVVFQDTKGTGASLNFEGYTALSAGDIYDSVYASEAVTTYSDYTKVQQTTAKAAMAAYAAQLIDLDSSTVLADTSLVDILNTWLGGSTNGGVFDAKYDPEKGGSLTISYTRSAGNAFVKVSQDTNSSATAEGDLAVGLDENDKIELTFTDPSSTSKVSGTSFVPTAYTLSGTLTAQKVYAASADPADEKTFVDGKITVNYSGEVTGLTFTVDGATGKASAVSQTSGKFGTEAGNTVVADVLMGPALGEAEKDTDNVWSVALAPVEVTYTVPTTTTVIVD